MTATDGQTDRLEHRHSARGSPLHYLLVAMGALFVFAPFAITPATDCVEYPCPLWLRGFIFLLGAVFGGGALVATSGASSGAATLTRRRARSSGGTAAPAA